MHPDETPQVTIVMTARDRFSLTEESLASIYANTRLPFRLVYVDAGSPPRYAAAFRRAAVERGFTLIRVDEVLYPVQQRNLGLRYVETEFVLFFENDNVVAEGWLEALLDCALETGADVVGPLQCQGEPLHQIAHAAGGTIRLVEETRNGRAFRTIDDHVDHQGEPVEAVRAQVRRAPTDLAEMHCMLVRTETMRRLGGWDEGVLNSREPFDFCLLVKQAGGTVYLEPDALVTFIGMRPLERDDLHYFSLRWSDAAHRATLAHLDRKWGLTDRVYYRKRYRKTAWRRKVYLLRPLLDQAAGRKLGFAGKLIAEALAPVEMAVNGYLSRVWERRPPREVEPTVVAP